MTSDVFLLVLKDSLPLTLRGNTDHGSHPYQAGPNSEGGRSRVQGELPGHGIPPPLPRETSSQGNHSLHPIPSGPDIWSGYSPFLGRTRVGCTQ